MAGITVDDLLNFGPLQADAQDSWARFLAGVEQNASFLQRNASQPIGDAWSGTAAELASSKISTTQGGLITSAAKLAKIHATLASFNETMSGYARQMTAVVNGAAGMVITPDGAVSYRILGPYSQQAVANLASVQKKVTAILSEANSLDNKTSKELMQYMPGPADLTAATDTAQKWTTVSADGSLWQIAEKEYGDGSKWQLIYDANRAAIGNDPNLIYAGMKLKIPALAGSAGSANGAKAGSVFGLTPAPTSSTTSSHPGTSRPQPSSSSSPVASTPLGAGEI